MTVPCGKCEYCVNTHASLWVQRLSQEMQCWKYTIFFTLTYDEQHAPYMDFDRHQNILIDFVDGYTIDISNHIDAVSREYLLKRRRLPVLSKQHCQKFFKLLRYYVHELHQQILNNENETLRYFLCGEYGETTLRPHYHALLFTNSDITAKAFSLLLSQAWKFGNTNWSFAKQDAPQYVAQYVNCSGNLPSIYEHKELRQFTLCSRRPPIGSLVIPQKEIFEIWDNGITERSFYDVKKQANVTLPLWRCIQDKLFPKCKGFGRLSHSDRVTLYGISKFYPAEEFDEFKESFNRSTETLINADLALDTPNVTKHLIELYFDNLDSKDDSVLRSAWRLSKRVLAQCAVFQCTLDYYVSRIENYYSRKELMRLKSQYEFEQDFALRYGPRSLLYLDTDFVNRSFEQVSLFDIPDSVRLIFESFGVDPLRFVSDYDYRHSLDIFYHPEYKDMVSMHKQIFKSNRKTKRKNDYLRAHPELNFF